MSARRLLLATVLPAALLAGPLAASAAADEPAPTPAAVGTGSGTLTFTAAAQERTPITKVEVDVPAGTPLQDATVPAVDGWTSAASAVPLPSCGAEGVSSVTWTATGGGIAPQDTGSFAIQVGRLADTDQVAFTGQVTYADGTVVSWTRPEPTALPAPFLRLASGTPRTAVAVSAAPTTLLSEVVPAPAAPTTGWTSTFVNLMTW